MQKKRTTSKPIDGLPRVVTRRQIAEHLGKDVSAVDRYVKAGHLKAVKVGNATLILVETLEAMLRGDAAGCSLTGECVIAPEAQQPELR